jgi:vanillate O-demethylase ferredoxin subunit
MLRVRVARKTIEALDICSFELVDVAGRVLPPFAAGSHVDVHLPAGLVRQYSLCNDPAETDRYVIGVLRDPASRGGSRAMHALETGAELDISTPKNHCCQEMLARCACAGKSSHSSRQKHHEFFTKRLVCGGMGR